MKCATPLRREPPEWAVAEIEMHQRLDAIRVVCDAVARGDWQLTPEIAVELHRLFDQAARWAERATALALAA